MDVRFGTTPGGQVVGFDTRGPRPLLLVGDDGRGKTTTARYLTRWWLANTTRHAHVFAQEPTEWSDLVHEPQSVDALSQLVSLDCASRSCLVVVDDIDSADDDALDLLPLGKARIVVTSHGGNSLIGRRILDGALDCVGLIRLDHASPAEAAVLDGQGRLDWPTDTVAALPDQRGPIDFPCHRWQAPAGAWTAVAQ